MRDRFEAVLTPAPAVGADLAAAADRDPRLAAIRIEDHVVRGVFRQQALAVHRGDDPAGTFLQRAEIGCVLEDEPRAGVGVIATETGPSARITVR